MTDEELGAFVRKMIDEYEGVSIGRVVYGKYHGRPGTRGPFEVSIDYPFDEYGGLEGATLEEAIELALAQNEKWLRRKEHGND